MYATHGSPSDGAQCAFFAARHAGADEMQARLREFLIAADRVGKVRVAAIDQHVALLEQRLQRCDRRIGRFAGLDHHQDPARRFERRDEFFERVGRYQIAAGEFGDQFVGFLAAAVVHRYRVTAALDIECEIAAHHREPDHTDCLFAH